MAATTKDRLDPAVFNLPVEKMRDGWYTDAYFNHTRAALLADGQHPHVTMQVFQKQAAVLGGVDEAIAILKLCADGPLTIEALHDGDRVAPGETVMLIHGDYTDFAHLETLYLGTLSRRTLITTNTVDVLDAARGKPVIFMPARHDHWLTQTGDGYAAHIAGQVSARSSSSALTRASAEANNVIGMTTEAQASWWGGKALGTVPHALIAAYGGDVVAAAEAFARWAPDDTNITVLVDFDNDSVDHALLVAIALGDRLWGVRLDTSESQIDVSLRPLPENRGVTKGLVRNVRDALDSAGYPDVKIVASGGFDVAKIMDFERNETAVDAYGVGSALLAGANHFTADLVLRDGVPCGKVGREFRPNDRLEVVA